eukprot:1809603-Rhodomonas_salina.2
MADPSKMHLQLAKHVLAYLKGSKERGLTFRSGDEEVLSGFSDSTWGNDPETRQSVSGYVFLLHGTAVSWKSKLEGTVALSSTEAEYQAIACASQEAAYLRQLLTKLGSPQLCPTVIYEDNKGCIAMVKNPVSREKAKHIDIKVKYVSQQYQEGVITPAPCASADMLSDGLTKPLPQATIEKHIPLYMGCYNSVTTS